MKKISVLIVLFVSTICACGPAKVEKYIDIKSNQTAFVIPLEGNNKKSQKKFMSLEYLEQSKVAAKRVYIPQKKVSTGRFPSDYRWIQTIKVILIDRSPVTREWTSSRDTGTTNQRQSFVVESKDSISFNVGCNCTASILEKNTPLFLYYFSEKPLSKIMDTNIRQYIQAILSDEFGKLDLGGTGTKESGQVRTCRNSKSQIFKIVFEKAKNHFQDMGITIDSLGLSEGLTFQDKDIQEAINKAFKAQMQIEIAKSKRNTQIIENTRQEEIAISKRKQAEEFAKASQAQTDQVRLDIEKIEAESMLIAAKRWNGQVPEKIVPENSGFLFGLN